MLYSGTYRTILFIFLTFTFTFCSKSKDTTSTDDPKDLKVEVLSIDQETGKVEIQATAQNANLYQFYIGSSESPEDANTTGYFEYVFDGQGVFDFTIRAYGASGRYIKANKEITISTVVPEEVPLSRGYFSPLNMLATH